MKISQENGYTIIDLDGDITFTGKSPAIEVIGHVDNITIKNGTFLGENASRLRRICKFIVLIWKKKI